MDGYKLNTMFLSLDRIEDVQKETTKNLNKTLESFEEIKNNLEKMAERIETLTDLVNKESLNKKDN